MRLTLCEGLMAANFLGYGLLFSIKVHWIKTKLMAYYINLFLPEIYQVFTYSDRAITGFHIHQYEVAKWIKTGDVQTLSTLIMKIQIRKALSKLMLPKPS